MNRRLWIGMVAAPAAWVIGFELSYMLVPIACQSKSNAILHITWLLALLVSLLGALTAHRAWRAAGSAWPGEESSPEARNRFLALFGLVFSATMMLLILAQWFPTLVLDPCTLG